jgi:hypothetical protein
MKAVDAAIASGKVRDHKSGMRAVLDILEKQ